MSEQRFIDIAYVEEGRNILRFYALWEDPEQNAHFWCEHWVKNGDFVQKTRSLVCFSTRAEMARFWRSRVKQPLWDGKEEVAK